SSRRRHTRSKRDWSSDVCSSDLDLAIGLATGAPRRAVLKAFGAGVFGTLAGTMLGPLAAHADCSNQGQSCAATKCCTGLSCMQRSEERRVGKEGRSGWATDG